MEGIERAKLKDSITQWLIDNSGEHYFENIYKSMNGPVKTQAHFDEIIKEMYSEEKRYFNLGSFARVETFSSNEFTQDFLDGGGFTNAREITVTKRELAIKQQQEDEEAKRVARKKDREQLTIVIFQKKTFWWVFGFGLIGGLYSVYQISRSILTTPNNVSQEQAGTRIDSIQNRLQQLENSIKQINTPIVNDSIQIKE